MSYVASWKLTAVAFALAAFPLVATAQTAPPQTGSQTGGQVPPQSQTPPQSQSPTSAQSQTETSSAAAEQVRQVALQHLTQARQSLADMTRLPAATHLDGPARNEVNQLITNFNALITSNGTDWRAAYDRVQQNLTVLIGPEAAGEAQGAQSSTVGTSGAATGAPPLDPSIASKLNEVRQHVDEFGRAVGVPPGQSAVQAAPAGTSGSAPAASEEALRSVDQMGALLDRVLGQAPPDSPTVSVSRQDLQQLRQYLDQLRQAIKR